MFRTMHITNMNNAFDVRDKNVIVTGGNRGIGKGIAEAFAQSGANVVIICRNKESGLKVIEEINRYGGKHTCIRCDVSDINNVKSATKDVFDFFDHVDVLVNNAGVATTTPFLSEDGLNEWHRVIRTCMVPPT